VIDSLNDLDQNVGLDFQPIISYIQSLLCNFNCAIFLFCSRSLNGLAHNLARWASFCSTWGPHSISSVPSWALVEDIDGPVPRGLPSVSFLSSFQ
jgi:hypothetical protein